MREIWVQEWVGDETIRMVSLDPMTPCLVGGRRGEGEPELVFLYSKREHSNRG